MGPRSGWSNARRRRFPAAVATAHLLARLVHLTPTVPVVGGLAALAGLAAYGRWIEPGWLDVTRTSVRLPRLPGALDGLVVVQLSDFHLRASARDDAACTKAIARCNEIRPDVVVLTGDYGGRRPSIRALRDLLAGLQTRPIFAVFGNHDYRYGRRYHAALSQVFSEIGIELLDNRAAAVERAGARVWFVGVGDGHSSHDRLDEALRGVGPDDHPRILLTHYPDLLRELPAGAFDLALAGHSHGGQLHLPILTRIALARSDTSYDRGWYDVNGVPLYVNRGLGMTNRPVRLFSRPELTVLTLRSVPKGEVDVVEGRPR